MKPKDCLFQKLGADNNDPAKKQPEEARFLNEDSAIREADACLAGSFCESCDLCRYFCPDLCVSRNSATGRIEIDYDFCKGCGVCAFICPKGAITMLQEEN